MCYNNVVYSVNRSSATVTATCRQHDSINKMEYNWNNQGFTDSSTFNVDKNFSDTLTLEVKATDTDGKAWTITVEPSNFVWQAEPVN